MRIQDLLKLGAGSLVELDRREGELAEIMVRQTLVARGEVVSIGGNYGLRIVEVVSREDRMALQHGPSTRARRHPFEGDNS
jgi:flagellar motor switch protein FliN/FliY